MSEEMRYRLQKMLWDRCREYIFGDRSLDRHGLWNQFLQRNHIVLIPQGEAKRHEGEDYVSVHSPMDYGALIVPLDFATKALLLGTLP